MVVRLGLLGLAFFFSCLVFLHILFNEGGGGGGGGGWVAVVAVVVVANAVVVMMGMVMVIIRVEINNRRINIF